MKPGDLAYTRRPSGLRVCVRVLLVCPLSVAVEELGSGVRRVVSVSEIEPEVGEEEVRR